MLSWVLGCGCAAFLLGREDAAARPLATGELPVLSTRPEVPVGLWFSVCGKRRKRKSK